MKNKCTKWKLLKKKLILKDGRYLKVEKRIYYNPLSKKNDKRQNYSIINFTPGGTVTVVALTAKNEILLLRQYRPAANRCIINLPGGRVEKGERPKGVIKKELEDETKKYSAPATSFKRIYETFQNPTRIIDKSILFFTKEVYEVPIKNNINEETAEEGREILLEDFKEVIKLLSGKATKLKKLKKEDVFDLTTIASLFLVYNKIIKI